MKSIRKSKSKDIDMLHGSLWDKILLFAMPLAATSILQQLFNAADVAVLGQFVGKEAMAAVGSNAPLTGLLVNIFVGLSIGSNVIIARYIGQRNARRISDSIHTSIAVGFIGGLIVMALGLLICEPMLGVLGVPAEIKPLAALYLRIIMIGMPFTMLYNFLAAIFRSRGDTNTPLIVLTISGCINVALNLFFVIVMHLGVAGVALATIIANALSAVMLLYVLHERTDEPYRISFRKLRIRWYILRDVMRIGIPSGLQGMVFSISNLIIQSAINSLGADVMAGSSAAFYLEIFAFFILQAFSQACTSFVSQNYGAGNLQRCHKVVRWCVSMNVVLTQALCFILIVFADPLLSIFNPDPDVIAMGHIRVVIILLFEFFNCINETLSAAMRGLGYSLVPALTSLIGICGVRIAYVYTIFPAHHTFRALLICYPMSWAVTMTVMLISYLLVVRKVLDRKESEV